MTDNPIARIRLWGSALLVLTVSASIFAAFVLDTSWRGWPWVIGLVAVAYGILSFLAHLRHPDRVDAAWDEQNLAAHNASLVFGYWATLAVFIGLLGAVWLARFDPAAAFFWMGPVLGVAPMIHYLVSIARGRAE